MNLSGRQKLFPIIGIRVWEPKVERKIIFADKLFYIYKKPMCLGIPYLALRIVLMDAPLMRPVCFEWGKGWGAEANLVNGGNLGTRTLGSEIQDSLNIVRKRGSNNNCNPFVFILDTWSVLAFVSNSSHGKLEGG